MDFCPKLIWHRLFFQFLSIRNPEIGFYGQRVKQNLEAYLPFPYPNEIKDIPKKIPQNLKIL